MVEVSDKKRLVALVLCFIFGPFGVHRFYVGKTTSAILMILTLGGFGIWALIDLIMIAAGSFSDKDEKLLKEWT